MVSTSNRSNLGLLENIVLNFAVELESLRLYTRNVSL